jgi:hypothetical protein
MLCSLRRQLVEQVDRRGGCAGRPPPPLPPPPSHHPPAARSWAARSRSQPARLSSVSACKVVSVAARARSLAAVVARCIHSVVVRSGQRRRFVLCWCFEAAAAAPWSRPVWIDAKQREVNAVAGALFALLFFLRPTCGLARWTRSLRQPPQNAQNSV